LAIFATIRAIFRITLADLSPRKRDSNQLHSYTKAGKAWRFAKSQPLFVRSLDFCKANSPPATTVTVPISLSNAGCNNVKPLLGTLHKSTTIPISATRANGTSVDKGMSLLPEFGLWTEASFGSAPSLSHSLILDAYDLRNRSGSLAMLAAICRASSLVLACFDP
jgi:hypothetical protein